VDAIAQYIKELQDHLRSGQATEHTYRPALIDLVQSTAKQLRVTNEPRQQECGAPDLIVTRGGTPLGYIETKDIGKALEAIESDSLKGHSKTDNGRQLKRYRDGLNNLILTDYLEFRWYVRGARRQTVRLATVDTKGSLRRQAEGAEQLTELFGLFLKEETPTIGSARELAAGMAALARVIRDSIERAFQGEDKGGSLHAQLEGFKTVLLHSLTHEQFADMYAQTICYGLFAAKCNHAEKKITRRDAAFDLPRTNPFLRKMFGYMAGPDLHEGVVWAVEDLVNLLNHADFHAILADFNKRTRRQDPIVHFYETFLAAYDPKLRETRGVYYTPEPVVSYIVRSIDHILKTDFGIEDGLADRTKIPLYETVTDKNGKKQSKKTGECHKVLILDPAVGTGSFLYGVIEHIHEHIVAKGQAGGWSNYVYNDLLPRLFGFELLMAPYAIAHLKLGLQLAETGYKPLDDEKEEKRLGIYLTNSLEEAHDVKASLPFANFISEEANAASEVKQDKPVMVILGNPPYSGHSENKGDWIRGLLRGKDNTTGKDTHNYFEVDGKPLGERNPKYLQDDYVKFIRFAQWRIEQTGYGVVGYISNNGYLDNPTFRGMRQSLRETFDRIKVLDLHGSLKKREVDANGSRDENVFDIQQGVCIGLFIKRYPEGDKTADLLRGDIVGSRKQKYGELHSQSAADTSWNPLTPTGPFYAFCVTAEVNATEYNSFRSVTSILDRSSNGFKTHRDHVAIAYNAIELTERVHELLDTSIDDQEVATKYHIGDTQDWTLRAARQKLRELSDAASRFVPCVYRPLDIRVCLYGPYLMDRPRERDMAHALRPNVCLAVGRQGLAIGAEDWNLVFAGSFAADTNLFRRGGIQYFPLYLYPTGDLFDNGESSGAPGGRRPNLNPDFVKDVAAKTKLTFIPEGVGDLKKTFGPEDIFHYMYAVFHSPTYRSRYAEFLKIDFPRLPLTSKRPLFRSLCALGAELVGLHLMEQHGPPLARFDVSGDNAVEKVRYTDEIATASASQPPRNDAMKGRARKAAASHRQAVSLRQPTRNDGPSKAAAASGKVWINQTQYFEGIPNDIWEFHIGGYQVCEKWLKDRKGRTLSFNDIEHYQRIVAALSETIRLMAEIDTAIDQHGGWPIS